jgi:HYDIN/CFA65/VesB family protein/ASPM-SPD-2-Hydin domain-containing protein
VKTSLRGWVCAASAVILSSSAALLSGCAGLVNANGTNPHAAIQVNPASVSFGSAAVGKKVSQTVSVANIGSMSVNISQANVSNSQFSVSGLVMPLSLPVGQSSSFQVSFAPNSSGNVTGTLTVTTDAGVTSAQVALSGSATSAAQQVSLNPASLNFGTVTVGSTGRSTATVSNVGGSNLMVSLISISGGPFGVSGITTPSTIVPGGSVTLNLTYSPTIAGSNSGSITITSNDPQTPTSTISLAGTATAAAVAPTITTAPANQTVTGGQTASFTVVAGGTAPLSYQWQKNGANIAGAISASYTTPVTTTADSGSTFAVVVTNTAGTVTSAAATLTVNAAAVAPTITTAPANQTVTAGQTASFTVVAGGTAPLSYQWQKNGANIAGAISASYTTPVTTTADSGSTFRAVVTNTAGTVTSAAATLTVNAAPAPAIQVSTTSINFGNGVVGSTLSQALIIKNIGTATLNISQITESGAGFSISGFTLPLNLNAGQQTTITAAFLPMLVGAASGGISIVSNAPTSPTSVALAGTGIAATLTLGISPTSLSFGNITTGTSSATQSVTITNTGNSNVTISQINTGGAGYSVTGGSTPVTLTPTQSLILTVQFSPVAAGSVNGSVSIVSNANGSPALVSLSGTGVVLVQHSVALTWNASTSTVSGYNVYRSTVSGSGYTKINSSLVVGLSYSDATVQNGTTYFYVTTAVDSSGVESSYSNQVSAPIP